ncbi:hypothetical protein TcCL_NonESM04530 [Trypanosoma cruzi]|nr:hypothetical protein TcCL_NonESM04530 [Trypanosoma cruzi]
MRDDGIWEHYGEAIAAPPLIEHRTLGRPVSFICNTTEGGVIQRGVLHQGCLGRRSECAAAGMRSSQRTGSHGVGIAVGPSTTPANVGARQRRHFFASHGRLAMSLNHVWQGHTRRFSGTLQTFRHSGSAALRFC